MSTIETLYTDEEQTEALYPRTKVEAISNANGELLTTLLNNLGSYEKVTTSEGTGIKFPNGLILNYGQRQGSHQTNTTFTLPMPLTTGVMIASATPTQTGYTAQCLVAIKTPSLTQAQTWIYSSVSATINFNWFILGY